MALQKALIARFYKAYRSVQMIMIRRLINSKDKLDKKVAEALIFVNFEAYKQSAKTNIKRNKAVAVIMIILPVIKVDKIEANKHSKYMIGTEIKDVFLSEAGPIIHAGGGSWLLTDYILKNAIFQLVHILKRMRTQNLPFDKAVISFFDEYNAKKKMRTREHISREDFSHILIDGCS